MILHVMTVLVSIVWNGGRLFPQNVRAVMLGQLHNGAIFQVPNIRVALDSDGQDGFCEPYSRGLNRIRVIAENADAAA